jgi:uncharacterized protein DUF6507
MSSYSIIPDEIDAVLGRTTTLGNELVDQYEAVRGPLGTAGDATGGSALIVDALDVVVAWTQRTLSTVHDGMAACLRGAADATNAYVTGDEEMAHEYGGTAGTSLQPTAVFPTQPVRPRQENGPRDTPANRRSRRTR